MGLRPLPFRIQFPGGINNPITQLLKISRQFRISHHRRLDTQINVHQWEPFLADCAAVDSAVGTWTPTTRAKLLQVILRILVEVYYLESSRSLRLRAIHVHPQVKRLLHGLGHDDLIKTMELSA